ncbi:MAG: hypothetical protein M3P27_05255 [Acidobacteriota bacterium]|nr:hypothetical protein [Acidobacteriota bacterium]
MKLRNSLFCVLLLAVSAPGSDETPTRTLLPGSSRTLTVPRFGTWGHAKCSADGSVFVHGDTGSINDSVVLKISADGSAYTIYDLPDEKSKATAFSAFDVTGEGDVWMLDETKEGELAAFHFNSAGKLSSETRLAVPNHLRARIFSVFPSGAMLVGGYFGKLAEKSGLAGKGYVALFERSGRLRKVLNAPDLDFDPKKITTTPFQGASAIGEDGNLYLLTGSQVVVMSETGEKLRTLKYEKVSEAIASNIVASQDLLALWLLSQDKEGSVDGRFLVINYQTGEPLATYTSGPELGNMPLCFSRQDGFTFLKVESGVAKFISAPLR